MATQRRIYLDWNATAPLSETVRSAMVDAMGDAGNPSSIHTEGRRVRDRVEKARVQVAALVGRPREQVVFTSSGTEANWLGVMALAAEVEKRGLPKVAATTAMEHPSLVGAVRALAPRGWTVQEAMEGASLVAVALVNHETGSIADVPAGALVHLDAVQAAGKMALPAHVDSLALSAHKLGGPQGVGAVVIDHDRGLPVAFAGHQERGRRPGTENVLGIVGLGAAAASVDVTSWDAVKALGDRLERGLLALPGVRIHGGAHRVGGTINAGFSGALGQDLVMALDLAGIAASTGAACTSGSVQPSPVLLALGYSPEQAREAVRFSLGRATTAEEVDEVLRVLPALLERARRHR